jgi:hypothetical protein
VNHWLILLKKVLMLKFSTPDLTGSKHMLQWWWNIPCQQITISQKFPRMTYKHEPYNYKSKSWHLVWGCGWSSGAPA